MPCPVLGDVDNTQECLSEQRSIGPQNGTCGKTFYVVLCLTVWTLTKATRVLEAPTEHTVKLQHLEGFLAPGLLFVDPVISEPGEQQALIQDHRGGGGMPEFKS